MNDTRSRAVRKSAGCEASKAEVEVGYTTRVLVQALFPYRKPHDKEIVARAGNTQITIYSPDGLPYGKYPRLVMAYLITQAVLRKGLPEDEARRIPLGSSINEFMELMGLTTRGTGGNTGSIRALREQLNRLATSNITVRKIYNNGTDRDTLSNVSIVDEMDVWFSHDPGQIAVDGSYLELTSKFYREIISRPIPIDMGVLKSLSKPRAMDLYVWATTRKYRLAQPLVLDWSHTQAQFGPNTPTNAQGRRNFKKDFHKAVEEVNAVWPDAGLELTEEGLVLPPGTPSIEPKA